MNASAVISKCGRYRYSLSRHWDDAREPLCFVMLNPSTADASEDDPTIRRCIGFARRDGYGGIRVFNLYAGRATQPRDLFAMDDPAGPLNEGAWADLERTRFTIICAWGADKNARRQAKRFMSLMSGVDLHCLGKTKDGHPRHPLYLKSEAPVELFAPAGTARAEASA